MSETMQTLTRKSVCVMLSLLLLLSVVLPVKAAAETASAKVVRVGSFEDTFNYVNDMVFSSDAGRNEGFTGTDADQGAERIYLPQTA